MGFLCSLWSYIYSLLINLRLSFIWNIKSLYISNLPIKYSSLISFFLLFYSFPHHLAQEVSKKSSPNNQRIILNHLLKFRNYCVALCCEPQNTSYILSLLIFRIKEACWNFPRTFSSHFGNSYCTYDSVYSTYNFSSYSHRIYLTQREKWREKLHMINTAIWDKVQVALNFERSSLRANRVLLHQSKVVSMWTSL